MPENKTTESQKTISDERALLYLLGCAINGPVPQRAVLCAMDWEAVCRLSLRHAVAAAACIAVESGLANADVPLVLDETQKAALSCWQDAKYKSIRKNMLLDAERTALGRYCESVGCWYLPLKGAVLKDLYPAVGMRQMSDNDILFDEAFREKIRDWFLARGFEGESIGRTNHDVYYKEPIYNFELHAALFNSAIYPAWAAYYADVQDRLLPAAPGRFERQFRKEDFYIYITLHDYKHFRIGGIGVRSLLDRYVFCSKEAAALDWTYIAQELQVLGIAAYEAQARALSETLFRDPAALLQAQLSTEEQNLLAYYIGSGTHGTLENSVSHQLAAIDPQAKSISGMVKARYLLRRIFPAQHRMLYNYPTLAKHKALLPLLYPHRLLVKAITKHKLLRDELNTVMKS